MTEEESPTGSTSPSTAPRPDWYWWVVMIGTVLSCAAASILISLQVQARALERERAQRIEVQQKADALRIETNAKWCKIVTTLDDEYRKTPPTTPTGVNIAEAMRDLRVSLDCPPA
jgi:hypothetical protein